MRAGGSHRSVNRFIRAHVSRLIWLRRRSARNQYQPTWVVNGFLNYFAVPTNSRAINSFYRHVGWYWFRALRRRSQMKRLTWARMKRLTDLWLPPARIRHPLPDVRFASLTRGGSPVR